VTATALDEAKRGLLAGSVTQVRGDLGRLADAGVTEVIVWGGGATVDAYLAGLERFREAAG
jgi:acetylglutamate kinase